MNNSFSFRFFEFVLLTGGGTNINLILLFLQKFFKILILFSKTKKLFLIIFFLLI